MSSSFTDSLRLEKQGIGENENTWGTKLNSLIDQVDAAIAGQVSITFGTTAGDVTLSEANGVDDDARHMVLILTGAPTSVVNLNLPTSPQLYFVRNKFTNTASVKMTPGGGGNTLKIPSDFVGAVISDGNRAYEAARSWDVGSVSSALREDITSLRAHVSKIDVELANSVARLDQGNNFQGNTIKGYKASVKTSSGPHTFTSSDSGRTFVYTNSTSINQVLPVNMPLGWTITMVRLGTAAVVVSGAGVSASIVNTSAHTGLNNYGAGAAVQVIKQEGSDSHAWYFFQGATE